MVHVQSFCELHSVLCYVTCLHVQQSMLADRCVAWRSGCCIQQRELLPAVFYSRQLQGLEIRYSAKVWQSMLLCNTLHTSYNYGRSFKVYTDHKALRISRVLNRRLQNWTLKLQDFDFKILYRIGVNNANTDGLSRQATAKVQTGDS